MKLYDSYTRACAVCLLTVLVMLVSEFSDTSICLCNNHTKDNEKVPGLTEQINTQNNEEENNAESGNIALSSETIVSSCKEEQLKPRMIEVECIQKKRLAVSEQEMEVLYRIVQAEAGGEDELGKKMVADVIVNRVLNDKFPDSVSEVVFQNDNGKVQFSPTKDGRFQSVTVSEETVEAVDEAMLEKDHTDGALYFVASSKASKDKVSWFETKLINKGTHGGHTFYQ